MILRLYDYKDLFLVFIWRELLIRYKQTALGVIWAVIQPFSLMLLFSLVFGMVLKIETKGLPRALFYYTGLVSWTFFSSSLSASINALTDHRHLITKIYFPRELIIFSKICVFLTDFFISAILLVGMLVYYRLPITLHALWIIPLCMLLFLFTATMSLLLGMLNVYYRDVKLASGFLLRFWFFATPVFYSIDTISIKLKLILFLNPLTFLVENIRRVIIEGRGVVVWQFTIEACFILLFFILSYRLFIRLERSFVDVI